jgi:hypothetical protein
VFRDLVFLEAPEQQRFQARCLGAVLQNIETETASGRQLCLVDTIVDVGGAFLCANQFARGPNVATST